MSQTVSSDPKTLTHAIDAAIGRKPTMPPDRYANHLMDEIFDEVEQVLDGSLLPPDEPVQVAFDKPDINLDIANMLAERYPLLAQKLEESNAAPIPDLPGPDIALHKVDEKVVAPAPVPAGLSLFERFMIFTGCASAVAALAVWLISQGLVTKGANFLSRQLATTSPVAMNAPAPNPVNPADVQFSDYVLRSLAALDRDAAANPQMVAIVPPAAPGAKPVQSGTMLPKPSPSNLKLGPNQVATAKPGTTLPGQPVVAVAPTDLVTRSEMNQVMNRIVGMLERVAPGVSNRLPLPAGTSAQATKTPVRIAAAVKPAAKPAAPQPASNEPKRRVSGVVEWGDKSVVTIEYNGATNRVYLGESVGSSGWTLIKVEGTKATFRKNGEFRTLSDGEFF
jgi:hypothetical protein